LGGTSRGFWKVGAFCWLAAGACGAAGCQQTELLPDPSLVPAQTPPWFDDRDWAAVLRENVRGDVVDYDHLARHRQGLERYLALISVVGPGSTPKLFPTRKHRLAYWINAYNAAALRVVLEQYPTETVYKLTGPSFEHDFLLRVDGRAMNLAAIRQEVYQHRAGDLRVLFCLCAAARGSPPLADQPIRADTLYRQLESAARKAMENPRLVRIEHATERLLVWQRLFTMRDVLVREYEAHTGARGASLLNVLMSFASDRRRRQLSGAVGYAIGVIPFDRSLNRWTPPERNR